MGPRRFAAKRCGVLYRVCKSLVSTRMQVSLSVTEQGGWLHVQLRVQLRSSDELAWGLDHCSPHRRLRWAVPQRLYVQWRQQQRSGALAEALQLCEPAVELWGQVPFTADGADALLFEGQVGDGLIARALLERMAMAEDLDDLDRDLQMLQLEAGITAVARDDSGAPLESLYEIGSERSAAGRPAPGRPEPFLAGPAGLGLDVPC